MTNIESNFGKPTKKLLKAIHKDREGKPRGVFMYEYDGDNRKVRKIYNDEEGRKVKEEEYQYDTKGNMVKVLHAAFSIDGKVFSRSTEVREYDNQNREIQNTLTDSKGSVYYKAQKEYDDRGRLARSRTIDSQNEEITSTIEHNYDEEKNRETVITRDKEGKISETTDIVVNGPGQEIATIKNAEGEIKEIEEKEFDSEGNVVKVITKNAAGEIVNISEVEEIYE